MEDKGSKIPWKILGLYSAAGLEFAAIVVLCSWLGLLLDHHWGTEPLMLIVLIILGFGAGLYNLIRCIKRFGL